MTVAIGWSGYMQQLLLGVGITLPTALSAAPPLGVINILAVLIVLAIMILLVIGIRESARANAVMVAVKLAAVLFFLATGATYVKPENWSPFAPFGWSGIMAAAAVVFFAYTVLYRKRSAPSSSPQPHPPRPAVFHQSVPARRA